jgi:HPt (histidine-containing phosphotransfer) domain-containing protein
MLTRREIMNKCKYKIQEFLDELCIDLEEGKELYSSYNAEMNKLIIEMKENIEHRDIGALCRLLHTMKGVAANFYINDIYEETVNFERLLKDNVNVDVELYRDNLIKHIQDAEQEINSFFEES